MHSDTAAGGDADPDADAASTAHARGPAPAPAPAPAPPPLRHARTSTPVLDPTADVDADSVDYLRQQNAQLWKIIEKQRAIIDNLREHCAELRSAASSSGNNSSTSSLARSTTARIAAAGAASYFLPEPFVGGAADDLRDSLLSGGFLPSSNQQQQQQQPRSRTNSLGSHTRSASALAHGLLGFSSDGLALLPFSLDPNNSAPLALPSRKPSIVFSPSSNSVDFSSPLPPSQSATPTAAASSDKPSLTDFPSPPPRSSSRTGTLDSRYGGASSALGVPLLDAVGELLPDDEIVVKVVGSLFQSASLDGVLFSIAVKRKRDDYEWKIEKRYSDFAQLDAKLRAKLPKQQLSLLVRLPEKSMFTVVNPIKNSQRKTALDLYLQHVLAVGQGNRDFLLFLTTTSPLSSQKPTASSRLSGDSDGDIDALFGTGAEATTLKEGYLMKKRNFGGWKPRYFKCKQYFLDYSDSPNKESVNTISLKHCHVTALGPPSTSSPDQQKVPMHALVLIEFHRDQYPVPLDAGIYETYKINHRHILVADDDRERDEWVAVIEQQIREARAMEGVEVRSVRTVHSGASASTNKHSSKLQSFYAGVTAMGGAVGGAAVAAAVSMNAITGKEASSSSSSLLQSSGAHSAHEINGRGSSGSANMPTVVHHIARRPSRPHTAGAVGSTAGFMLTADHFKSTSASETVVKNSTDDNARAMLQMVVPLPMLVGTIHATGAASTAAATGGGGGGPTGPGSERHISIMGLMQMRNAFKKKTVDPMRTIDASRAIFGMSLDHGVKVSRISDDLELPAVVYRCIEFLDFHKASQEEGIYRLSGSASAIQSLKALFNSEADVDLIAHATNSDQIDVHVVSGLLKLYLRELATPILTNSLQKMFAEIIDLDDRNDRVLELSRLISQLPKCNYILLKVLSSHLLSIVQASSVNKMNVRNMGIVFAPTLGVPAVVFILMLAEFEDVFCWDNHSARDANEEHQRRQLERRQKVEDGIKELLARKESER